MPITTKTLTAGNWEMAVGATVIPAELLGDITVDYEEGTVERSTQAGNFSEPSYKTDTATATFTLFLPNMDYLQVLYADAYSAGTSPQKTGNIIFGTSECTTRTPLPINIHHTCSETDDDDIHIFAGIIRHVFNNTLSSTDAVQLECEILMQKTDDGVIRFGTGNLTAASRWDATTQTTVTV